MGIAILSSLCYELAKLTSIFEKEWNTVFHLLLHHQYVVLILKQWKNTKFSDSFPCKFKRKWRPLKRNANLKNLFQKAKVKNLRFALNTSCCMFFELPWSLLSIALLTHGHVHLNSLISYTDIIPWVLTSFEQNMWFLMHI